MFRLAVRAVPRSRKSNSAKAVTGYELARLVATCRTDSLRDVRHRAILMGRVAKLAIGRVEPIITQLSRFVNLLKSEEAPEQIVLIVDGPLAGKSEAFAQPQHRFEPGDRPASRFE